MPIISGEGGGSFNGGAITEPLTITTGAGIIPLSIHVPSGNDPALALYNDTFDPAANDPAYAVEVDDDGSVDFLCDASVEDTVTFTSGNFNRRIQGRLLFGGGFLPTEPADALLVNSSFALWLDPTPGVGNTKLMVKAKDSGGTVHTATFVLA